MPKPILMIHRINDRIWQHPLEKFILTFDDGYDDCWTSLPRLLEIPTQKIFFITCDWVGRNGFLSLDQIRKMQGIPEVVIGAHGFSHECLDTMNISEKIRYITEDTQKMCDWFRDNLGFLPKLFAFPYNDSANGIYTQVVRDHGFTEFYGQDRIDVSWLDDPDWLRYHRLW